MANDAPEEVQRRMAKRRVALVVSILKGETSVQQAARKHELTVAEVEDWQERFLLAAENGLRARPKDEEALKDEYIKKLKQKIGRSPRGSAGTTRRARTRRWAIGARANIGRNRVNWWLDFGGALHELHEGHAIPWASRAQGRR